MDTLEIRQSKKKSIPMIALLILSLLAMNYYIYLSGKYDDNSTIKLLYIFLNSLLIYAIYNMAKKILTKEPVLIFSESEIEINETGKSVSLLWLQIIDYKIEKDNENGGSYLVIETADTKRRINISWLDRTPDEIEELLHAYKRTNQQ